MDFTALSAGERACSAVGSSRRVFRGIREILFTILQKSGPLQFFYRALTGIADCCPGRQASGIIDYSVRPQLYNVRALFSLHPVPVAPGKRHYAPFRYCGRLPGRSGAARKFGIDVVPLPCPETLYLGPDREPGTYLERLNTPEFATLLEGLRQQVDKIIEERGPPLCILGVNSSPTCGVTSTYYGAEA